MRAARLHGVGDIRLADEPLPTRTPGTSLIKVTAVGICGSDLHWYTEAGIGDAQLSTPLVIGHEFAGVIEGGSRHGERVAVDPAIPCGICESCREGNHNLCPAVAFSGHSSQDGALREYLTWPTDLLHTLPDSVSDADGAMLEPLGVAVHAVDLSHLRIGSTVAVVGCGPIGLCVVQLARAAGATTIVVAEPLAHRREAALRYGADLALTPDEFLAGLDTATGGRGVDVAFEVAGNDPAIALAVGAVRPGARVLLAGIPDDDRSTFSASAARRKGLALIMVRRMNDVYPRTIALLERGVIDVRSMVTGRYPLTQVQQAFDAAVSREGLKVVVEVSA